MKIKVLQSCHADYDGKILTEYNLLYKGGKDFLAQVVQFLPQRKAEPVAVYNERCRRAFYIGYIGPIVDFFTCNLFGIDANIKSQPHQDKGFYPQFFKDVDRKQTEFNTFFKKVFTNTIIQQKTYILVDFPQRDSETAALIKSRADEARLGLDRAFLVEFTREQLIDWNFDEAGNFQWIKFYTKTAEKPSFDAEAVIRHNWYIYDKYGYQVFQFDETEKNKLEEGKEASLIASGTHMLPGKVPVLTLELPDGLWIINKIASVQSELFNLDNALAWQEYQAHYSMPVIKLKDNKPFNQRFGEGYYIKLGIDESFEWSEPEGKMMEVGLKRREMLKDELYRIIHQLSLSIKQTKSQTKQSGQSKQEDRHATEVILCAFGDVVREAMQKILTMISEARGEKITWDVSGFSTFDTETLTEKLAQALQVKAYVVHSETYQKELEKRIVDLTIEDANQEIKQKIHQEIDSADLTVLVDPLANFAPGKPVQNTKNLSKPTGVSQPSRQPQAPNNTATT
jgi:hypothetical protein